ncbi:tRNA epoxyqueuosine(34) reductase QueG [Asticcacaulis sp. BYS171W]|uniref:tRNA epoxyqueuosine(34) reductase QueG n=1 Tax=Asticcacaulis aquaticus TaxID=2984212 RepID=A0ABT5HRT5_9CAUL|nr:tRNA epoxyqueuosine(34) reductase QueG [Asticcacaulis aquaticus]MDC7682769.1 tRNA epoxyqueuosine(34) reductase QueG [Asticcacaulis aquaticus]
MIEQKALDLGFATVGFVNLPQTWEAAERLKAFVAEGYHGAMTWMEETLERRQHPQNMWSGAKSAIVLGFNYGPDSDPLVGLNEPDIANISVYARGDDYHDLIKKKLKLLATDIVKMAGCEVKVFVDTAPLMEKPLAQLAGLGWQGKHTNVVSREFGSWMFLGVILTDMELPEDRAEKDHCGSCRSCLDICPTNAFVAPYKLDARSCLSYLTIEYHGHWPKRFREQMGNRIYGCDDCLAVCPWNKFAQSATEAKLMARDGATTMPLFELAQLDDPAFRALFSKSPIKRIGLVTFLRNIHYAIGNSFGDLVDFEKIDPLVRNLRHDSPVVRGSAVWALSRGLPPQDFAALRDMCLPEETDPEVLAEWRQDAA